MAAGFAMLGVLLVGCGSDERPTALRLKFWAMGVEAEASIPLLREFERRHPGLHVDVSSIPWSVAHEKLLTAHVGDALPDVFQIGNTWIAELAAIGALQDLQASFASAFPEDDFFSGILAANRVGDGLYGIPWYVDTRVLFYRADLLDRAGLREPPRSWDQWAGMVERLTPFLSTNGHVLGMSCEDWRIPVILALQQNGGLLRDDGRYGHFSGPSFRRAFAFFVNAFRQNWASAQGSLQTGNPVLDFVQERTLMFFGGPWILGELAKRLPPESAARWNVAPLPSWDGRDTGVSLAGGASLGIAARSQHREAAWTLVEFLAQSEQQVALYRHTGDLPSRRSSWRGSELQNDHAAHVFRGQLENTVPVPQVPEWERIAARIGHYAELAVRGVLTEHEALSRLDRDVDDLLRKRRWLLQHP